MKRLIAAAAALFSICAGAQELRKSVTWENIRNHPAPLPVVGELAVRQSSLDAPSRWSVGAETMDRDYADFSQFRKYMKDTGVGYSRLQSGWAKTEKKKGEYNFAWLDEHVDGLIEEGIHPWICLCYGNPLYSEHGSNLGARLFMDGPVMEGWLNYVRATVSHFKGKVTMWEVWNEPDGSKNLDSWPEYANMFVRTARVIREIDPGTPIAAFASCSPSREYIRQGLQRISELGGLEYVDYITFHGYWPVPEKIIPAIRRLRADVDRFSPSIGLLQGETGCPGQLEYAHAMCNIEWNEYSQAKWDLRQALNHFSLGIPYSFFTMVDLNYGWMLQSYGLLRCNLRHVPMYKRPKYYAVQHVTSLLPMEVTAVEGISATCSLQKDICCIGLARDGKKIGCLLWLTGEMPTGSLERSLSDTGIDGCEFKDPVYVDMLTGLVHSLDGNHSRLEGSSFFKDLPLWDCPVAIIEKEYVPFK